MLPALYSLFIKLKASLIVPIHSPSSAAEQVGLTPSLPCPGEAEAAGGSVGRSSAQALRD